MQLGITPERPPYVTYELRAVEDRSASMEGRMAFKDVAYALITPMGSKDRFERVVSEWFVQLEKDVQNGRFNPGWLRNFRAQFHAWQNDQEAPIDGTPLKMWPLATPGQIKSMTDLRLRSVEDLAAANEEVIHRLGMGGRTLVQKARDFLEASKSSVPLEELSRVKAENETLRTDIGELRGQVKDLLAVVGQLKPELLQKASQPVGNPPDEAPTALERDLGFKL